MRSVPGQRGRMMEMRELRSNKKRIDEAERQSHKGTSLVVHSLASMAALRGRFSLMDRFSLEVDSRRECSDGTSIPATHLKIQGRLPTHLNSAPLPAVHQCMEYSYLLVSTTYRPAILPSSITISVGHFRSCARQRPYALGHTPSEARSFQSS